METIVKVKYDKRGSEGLPNDHYTFDSIGDIISGGLYIKKGI